MPKECITPGQWNAQGRLEDFGKFGVKGCSVPPPFLATNPACRPAQRALGGEVHGIRVKIAEQSPQLPAWSHSQINTCITWTRTILKESRMQHQHIHTTLPETVDQLDQRGDYTVDLRLPCVGALTVQFCAILL